MRDLILLSPSTSTNDIASLINFIRINYIASILPNSRNGGLISLAAIAIALGTPANLTPFLEILIPPVFACFADHDSRVRYERGDYLIICDIFASCLYQFASKSNSSLSLIQVLCVRGHV